MSFNPLGLILPGAALGLGSLLIRPVRRGFLPEGGTIIVPQAVVEERHHDEVEITEHPIENGASIADHAYKMPAEVTIRAAWSNSPSTAAGGSAGNLISKAVSIGSTLIGGKGGVLGGIANVAGAIAPTLAGAQSLLNGNAQGQVKQIYDKFLELQSKRVLFDVVTGKRSYKNMLIKSLSTETDKNFENAMVLTIVCRQIIIVVTQISSTSTDSEAQAHPAETSAVQDLGPKSLLPGGNMIPDSSSLIGSLGDVTAGLGDMQNVLGSVSGSVMDAVGGAIGGLPDILSGVQGALSDTLSGSLGGLGGIGENISGSFGGLTSGLADGFSGISLPFEIPALGNIMQNFSLPLDVGGLTDAMQSSLQNLEPALEGARTAITNAAQQLPSVVGNFTSDIAGTLQTQFAAAPDMINNALKNIGSVFQRNQ